MNFRVRIASPKSQHGMAMIAALFMIVVVAALGVFAIRLGTNQEQTANLQLRTYRVEVTASSGLELLIYRARNGVCLADTPAPPLSQVTLTLSCTGATTHFVDAATQITVFDLTATASQGAYGTPDFVQRRVTRRVGGNVWSSL